MPRCLRLIRQHQIDVIFTTSFPYSTHVSGLIMQRLTGKPWDYVKVLQTEYNNLQATQFSDLLVLGGRQLL